jgi:hypothetical protein
MTLIGISEWATIACSLKKLSEILNRGEVRLWANYPVLCREILINSHPYFSILARAMRSLSDTSHCFSFIFFPSASNFSSRGLILFLAGIIESARNLKNVLTRADTELPSILAIFLAIEAVSSSKVNVIFISSTD